ncbi:hypothetical protein ADUPG1_010164, partial [Aduncisulcus paluster]
MDEQIAVNVANFVAKITGRIYDIYNSYCQELKKDHTLETIVSITNMFSARALPLLAKMLLCFRYIKNDYKLLIELKGLKDIYLEPRYVLIQRTLRNYDNLLKGFIGGTKQRYQTEFAQEMACFRFPTFLPLYLVPSYPKMDDDLIRNCTLFLQRQNVSQAVLHAGAVVNNVIKRIGYQSRHKHVSSHRHIQKHPTSHLDKAGEFFGHQFPKNDYLHMFIPGASSHTSIVRLQRDAEQTSSCIDSDILAFIHRQLYPSANDVEFSPEYIAMTTQTHTPSHSSSSLSSRSSLGMSSPSDMSYGSPFWPRVGNAQVTSPTNFRRPQGTTNLSDGSLLNVFDTAHMLKHGASSAVLSNTPIPHVLSAALSTVSRIARAVLSSTLLCRESLPLQSIPSEVPAKVDDQGVHNVNIALGGHGSSMPGSV